MPFIDLRLSGEISKAQETELKADLGKAIALIPGKAESHLMVQFTDHCRLWFGGEQGPIVFVNVMLYGASTPEHYGTFKDYVIPLLEKKLGAKSVYLKFEEVPNWYWN